MTKHHIIFEHSKIKEDCIGKSAFEWLTHYILEDEEKQPPFIKHYGNRLQVKNYVGIIETPCGTCIEVLPKIYKDETEAEKKKAKQLLWKMLSVVYDLKSLEATEANLEKRQGRLIDSLISYFLQTVSRIVHRGLRSDYVRIQAERNFIKGRLRVGQQLRQPPSKQHKFQIEYDCFLPNRPENRLLKTALQKVLKWTLDSDNQRHIRQLLSHFDDIPLSTQLKQDLTKWSTQRDMIYYQAAKPWIELILAEQTPWFNKGSWQGISLLFPMEKLFEKYVAKCLANQLNSNLKLRTQLTSEYLVKHYNNNLFQLKPDLAIFEVDKLVEHEACGEGETNNQRDIRHAPHPTGAGHEVSERDVSLTDSPFKRVYLVTVLYPCNFLTICFNIIIGCVPFFFHKLKKAFAVLIAYIFVSLKYQQV